MTYQITPPVVEIGLEAGHRGRALFPGEQVREVFPDLRVGVHGRPGLKVGLPPLAERESLGAQSGMPRGYRDHGRVADEFRYRR
jgi:hypothetical protein